MVNLRELQDMILRTWLVWTGWISGKLEDIAGYDMGNLVGLDGLDQWKTIKNGEQSPRTEILYNIGKIQFN